MLVPKTELRSRLPEGDQVAPEAGRDGVGREEDGRGGGRERELRCGHGLSVCCPGWPSGAYLVCWAGAAGERPLAVRVEKFLDPRCESLIGTGGSGREISRPEV